MRKIIFSVFLLLAAAGLCYPFGTDVVICNTSVSTFDADYNLNTGTMFVAAVPTGKKEIWVYISKDHGQTWTKKSTISGTCNSQEARYVKRVRVLYSEKHDTLLVFFVTTEKKLCVATIGTPEGSFGLFQKKFIASNVLNLSLEATQDLSTGDVYVAFMDGTLKDDHQYIFRSSDLNQWSEYTGFRWSKGGSAYQSIAYGPPDNVLLAYSTQKFSSNLQVAIRNISHHSQDTQITSDSYCNCNPIVAQSNTAPGVTWVFYNTVSGNNHIVRYHYTTDWSNWHGPYVLSYSGYIGDVKFYKASGNKYMNIAWVDLKGNVYRAWTSTDAPHTWQGKTKVNDKPSATTFYLRPKIVYSPGAPAPGGGVVFAAQGKLYFDAPWFSQQSPTHSLSISVNGQGSVSSSPSGINCPTDCSAEFDEGTTVTLTANPESGYEVEGWSDDCSSCTGNTCTITMDSDKTCSVSFKSLTPSGNPVPSAPTVRLISPSNSWLSLGADATDGVLAPPDSISVIINSPEFAGPVNLYAAIEVPGYGLLLINENNQFVSAAQGIPPFRTNVSDPVSLTLLPPTPIVNPITNQCILPEGTYTVYTLVLPADKTVENTNWESGAYLLEYYQIRVSCH